MSEPLVDIRGLVKAYQSGPRELRVLDGVDLTVAAGDTVSIVGDSGAGKSTLLHLIGALDTPTSGEIVFDGQALGSLHHEALAALRNREMGYVWQNYHLLPEFSAIENVSMPLRISGRSREESESYARKWIEHVGLAERGHHRAGELSGGEQQRVALARALAHGPRLVLADEPTGNLDHDTGTVILDVLLQLAEERGLALLMATHNWAFAQRCRRNYRVERGKLIELE